MTAPVFIGDETSAAGFRLAGLAVETPEPGDAGKTLARARLQTGLILITGSCARDIPADDLRDALAARTPLLIVIPDIANAVAPPDLEKHMRAIMGIEA